MKLLVIGSKDWTSYSDVMRQVTIVLEDMKHTEDTNLTIVHTGSVGAENMVSEYVGKVEKFLRQKGYSIKEQLFRGSNSNSKSINDYEMINAGADFALIFAKDGCKRSFYCTKMIEESGIPFEVIKD